MAVERRKAYTFSLSKPPSPTQGMQNSNQAEDLSGELAAEGLPI